MKNTKVKYSFAQWCNDNGHKDWLDLWDYELNEFSPDEVAYRSGKKYWFKCQRGLHESELKQICNLVSGRTHLFCKRCRSFGQFLLDEFGNNAIEVYWSDKNEYSPFDISKSSKNKIFIKCLNDDNHPDYLTTARIFYCGCRCPICASTKTFTGFNDIATTHQEYIKYFLNKDDAKIVSKGSEKFVDVICPDCGHTMKKRICDIISFGFNCPRCGDGTSYPNKYMYEFLMQLKNRYGFEIFPEHVFEWSSFLGENNKSRKIYDFYIEYNGNKIIVEVHGYQHFTGSFYRYGHTVEYEMDNDIYKKELAINNGIHESNYIVIDARKSNSDWIKASILNCGLSQIFPFEESSIDWSMCNQMACKSLVKIASDIWNNGVKSTSQISKILGKSKSTIISYLKIANDIGWCVYNPKYRKTI